MADEASVNLAADPRVMNAIKELQLIVPEANLSQIIRAAVLYVGEGAPEHEFQVYIEEQINLEME